MDASIQEEVMASERWEIDSSHSSLHFSVRHLVIAKVRGSFARWSGTIQVPDGDFSKATVAVTIDASSIDTGVADRDGHLKSPDFFDVAQYPELRFVGKRVQPRSAGEIDVVGESDAQGNHARSRPPCRTTRPGEGPVGQRARGVHSEDVDRSQGLRAHVEPGAGDRRGDGRRPRGHRSRDRSGQAGRSAGRLSGGQRGS